jgi:hypothetical protein
MVFCRGRLFINRSEQNMARMLSRFFVLTSAITILSGSAWAAPAEQHPPNEETALDAPALLAKVQENQKVIDALVEKYACRKSVEELEPAKDGSFRSKSVKEYEVFYLGGREVERLVAEDGKPLPPGKQQDETRRVEKKVKEFQRDQEKREARQARGEAKKEDEPGTSVFLRVSKFTNPRRVEFRGQRVVAFDFEPLPDYHPKTRLEKVLQGLAGTAWVDDQAKEIVKLEAHFARSLKFGGGLLASVHEGSAFVFEQTLVNKEVWLPSFAEIHMSGRVLIKGIKVDQIVRYSEYKKFRVETLTQTGRPKEE